ncbi:hypothetical protein ACTXT7_003093 [Hymenolepis weldensis]
MSRYRSLGVMIDIRLAGSELKNLLAYDIIEHPMPSRSVPQNIYFSALNRSFKVKLDPLPNTIRKTQINLIYDGEIIKQHKFDLPEEIHGILENEFLSKVSILIGSNGEFCATIKTPQEIYLFEPNSGTQRSVYCESSTKRELVACVES